ncbi:GGDEF domain-containing protein [Marinicella meishanensis]|uniref:GGDEF domain-containing protein n=1 Tax=Marinicella meishanensis TaxID=2873263 RepID=UPI001CBF5D19|nr:GGDEF domain-containing protein [Marinicella sp. NBU2979]
MALSDVDLINISQFLISLMMTVVFLLAWRIMEKKTYVLMWSLFYVFAAVNGILNAINDLFPDRNLYWVVVNGVSLLTQALALAGFRMRAGRRPFPPMIMAYFLLVELLVVVFTYWQPHMGLRMVFIPFSGAVVVFAIVREIARTESRLRTAEISAMVLFALYAVVQLTSGTLALLQGAARNEHWLSLYSQVNFLFMPAFFAGLGLFTLLILVDDLASKLKHQAITDYLTGLLNRRGFKQQAEALIQQQDKLGKNLAVIVADIDHFKKINDQYGHQVGDEVLKEVSMWMNKLLLPPSVMGRTGGEEFAVVVPVADLKEAGQLAEHLRLQLSEQSHKTNAKLRITGSFGVALIHDQLESALIQADHAMYQAKAQGRDRVVLAA